MTRRGRRWLLPGVAALMAAVIALAYWRFGDYFASPATEVLPLDGCDLQKQACRRALPGGGELVFEILPRPIPLVQPLQLKVDVKGLEVDGVEVDFSGVTMNMGYNRPRLERVGEGRFRGEGMLPVCVRQRMDWEAKVLLHLPHGVLAVPYRFHTIRS